MSLRTLEEISADMTALVRGADGRVMKPAELKRYVALETELQGTRETMGVQARQAAYETVQPAPTGFRPGLPASGDATNEDPALTAAFVNFLRSGRPNADISGLRVSNAQSEGTGSEGGYLVPTSMRNKIVERMKAFGGIGNQAEELVTEGGGNIEWPTVDDTGNTANVVAENATTTSGADVVFGTKTLGAHIYMANGASGSPLRLPLTLLQDAAFDVESKVSNWLGTRIYRAQAAHWVTGNGVGQPLGIVTGITGTEMSSGGPTYSDLIDFTHTVDPAYREMGNCKWGFNDTSLKAIEKLVDSNGDPIWRGWGNSRVTNMGEPLSGGYLLGYPVVIDQAFGNIVAANGADDNWGVFGDIREGYIVRRVRDVQLIVNPWSRAAYLQIEYTAWARADGRPQNTNAYGVMAGYTA